MKGQTDYFKAICEISRQFGKMLDMQEILVNVVKTATSAMEAKGAVLWFIQEDSGRVEPVAHEGLSDAYFDGAYFAESFVSVVKAEGYLYSRHAPDDPRLEKREQKRKEGVVSMLVVPVNVRDKLIGYLSLYTAQEKEFSDDEIDFLMALAEQGGMAADNARLFEKLRGYVELFHSLAVGMNANLDISKVLNILTEELTKALNLKAASVRLIDEQKKELKLIASYGLSEKYTGKGAVSSDKSIREALDGKTVVITDATSDERVQYRKEKQEEGLVSILSVPVKTREKVIGVLRLYSGVARDFPEDEIKLVTALAHQGGLAIQNSSALLEMQQDLKEIKEEVWSSRSWF